jgi:hypothetical protein
VVRMGFRRTPVPMVTGAAVVPCERRPRRAGQADGDEELKVYGAQLCVSGRPESVGAVSCPDWGRAWSGGRTLAQLIGRGGALPGESGRWAPWPCPTRGPVRGGASRLVGRPPQPPGGASGTVGAERGGRQERAAAGVPRRGGRRGGRPGTVV